MVGRRKLLLAVRVWSSEESVHAYRALKAHILQPKGDGLWQDELLLVHVSRGIKDRERPWDSGSAVMPSLVTAMSPYTHEVYDTEGEPGPVLVDIANREQADIVVLATRGRTAGNAMKKAVSGSTTEYVMTRANCACLVIKPQIGAGDTYRMKSAAQPQSGAAAAVALATVGSLNASRGQSPATSPMPNRLGTSVPPATPFNRRVAIAYDTTASGRVLLKWAAEHLLEPADNVFVVRAVPKMRRPGASFADKGSVQRLAGDVLQGQAHITSFNLPQGNACKQVLNFVARESVDLLVVGVYKPGTRGRGLGRRGNAQLLANRCACPCVVVPIAEAALQAGAAATGIELAAAEEELLASSSESDSSEDEGCIGSGFSKGGGGALDSPGRAVAGTDVDAEYGGGSPELHAADAAGTGSPEHGGSSGLAAGLRGSSVAAMKQLRAPLEAFFKRRNSMGVHGSDGGAVADRRGALAAALQGSSGGSSSGNAALPAGRYIVEVDTHGAVRSVRLSDHRHHAAQHSQQSPTGAGLSPSRSVGSPVAAPVGAAAAVSTEQADVPGVELYPVPLGVETLSAVPVATAAAAAVVSTGAAPGVQLVEPRELSLEHGVAPAPAPPGPDDAASLEALVISHEAELVKLRERLEAARARTAG